MFIKFWHFSASCSYKKALLRKSVAVKGKGHVLVKLEKKIEAVWLLVSIPPHQKKMRGQKRILPVHALGYVNSTKVIHKLALERKGVFRDVCIKDHLDLMWLATSKTRQMVYLEQ